MCSPHIKMTEGATRHDSYMAQKVLERFTFSRSVFTTGLKPLCKTITDIIVGFSLHPRATLT